MADLTILDTDDPSPKGGVDRDLRWASTVARAGWTVAHNVILFDRELSSQTRLLYFQLGHYAFLCEHAGQQSPEQSEIAANLGVKERALRPYLRELEDAGLLEINRRGRGLSNTYTLHEPTSPGTQDRQSTAGLDRQNTAAQTGSKLPVLEVSPYGPKKEKTKTANAVSGDSVQTVYDHWRTARGKTRASYDRISSGRKAKIEARLREFSVEDLCRAVDGIASDPWEDRGLHDDLTKIFRNQESVERFLDLAEGIGTKSKSKRGGMSAKEIYEFEFPEGFLDEETS